MSHIVVSFLGTANLHPCHRQLPVPNRRSFIGLELVAQDMYSLLGRVTEHCSISDSSAMATLSHFATEKRFLVSCPSKSVFSSLRGFSKLNVLRRGQSNRPVVALQGRCAKEMCIGKDKESRTSQIETSVLESMFSALPPKFRPPESFHAKTACYMYVRACLSALSLHGCCCVQSIGQLMESRHIQALPDVDLTELHQLLLIA